MADSTGITILAVNRLDEGDVLITFSDETVVLYHAQFLYEMRSHDHNIEIVAPFDK